MAETDPLIDVRGLSRSFGALRANDGIDLTVLPGEIHAVIGPNGAGKTTMIGLLAGEIAPDAGSIRFRGQDITGLTVQERALRGLARSFQITSLCRGFTALENVMLAVQARSDHSFRFLRRVHRDRALVDPARDALDAMGLLARADTCASYLSHGEQRQLELAIALAMQPALLLLDEPAAGMSPDETRRLVAIINGLRRRTGVLLVEHDMDTVFALADRITVLVYGKVIATGTPDAIRADPAVRDAYLGHATVAA